MFMRKITVLFMALVAMTSVAGNLVKAVDRDNLDLCRAVLISFALVPFLIAAPYCAAKWTPSC